MLQNIPICAVHNIIFELYKLAIDIIIIDARKRCIFVAICWCTFNAYGQCMVVGSIVKLMLTSSATVNDQPKVVVPDQFSNYCLLNFD